MWHESVVCTALWVGEGSTAQPRESRSKWVNWLHLNCHIYQSSSILTSIYLLLLVGHLKKLCSVLNDKRVKHSGEENISKYFVYRGQNWRTSILHCIDGLGWAGLGWAGCCNFTTDLLRTDDECVARPSYTVPLQSSDLSSERTFAKIQVSRNSPHPTVPYDSCVYVPISHILSVG